MRDVDFWPTTGRAWVTHSSTKSVKATFAQAIDLALEGVPNRRRRRGNRFSQAHPLHRELDAMADRAIQAKD